jgi:hypothetical protein
MAALLNKLRKARKDEETTSNQATQRSRRATKNRKKSKDPPAKAAPKPTLDGSVRQQNSIRKPKKKPSQAAPANTKLRRKLTGQNKQPVSSYFESFCVFLFRAKEPMTMDV